MQQAMSNDPERVNEERSDGGKSGETNQQAAVQALTK